MLLLYLPKSSTPKGSFLPRTGRISGYFPREDLLNNIIQNRDKFKINYSDQPGAYRIVAKNLQWGYIPFCEISEEKVKGRILRLSS
jgi:hypothetical protein